MNHKEFISNEKSLLIAPAGYGKTHSIAECLQHTKGRQLILTHTHTGVASIKGKLLKSSIPAKNFYVETISSYAQKHVLSYYTGKDMPAQEDSPIYFPFVIQKATALLRLPILQRVVKASYTGVFVDEYQDCTLLQHRLILALSEVLPVRILGDPLQSIFNFEEPGYMVDLDDGDHMLGFHTNRFVLDEPWRWKGQNEPLGEALKTIRAKIEAQENIDLSAFSVIEYIHVDTEEDLYNPMKKYYKDFSDLLKLPNLLILHPDSTSINPRKKVIKSYRIPIKLIEAIDDKKFYEFSKLFDDLANRSVESVIYTVCLQLFNKSEVNKWISEKGAKKKTKAAKETADALMKIYGRLPTGAILTNCSSLLLDISNLPDVRCYRKELLQSLCGALEEAANGDTTVYSAMLAKRNVIRRVGRKVFGRCIGTTLLTKGLEFDTVVILNAHRFSCPKHLYVALTRACKRLIVFSTTSELSPYLRKSKI